MNEGWSNLLAKGVQSKLEKDVMHIDYGASVGHLVKVVAHHLGLLHENALSVVTESLDVEDVRSHLTLPFPLLCCVCVYVCVCCWSMKVGRNVKMKKAIKEVISSVCWRTVPMNKALC